MFGRQRVYNLASWSKFSNNSYTISIVKICVWNFIYQESELCNLYSICKYIQP